MDEKIKKRAPSKKVAQKKVTKKEPERKLPPLEERDAFRRKVFSIWAHIDNVRNVARVLAERLINNGELDLARRLAQRVQGHDESKFTPLEFDGMFSEDKALLKLAVEHHRSINPHHPQFHNSINHISDLDACEIVCDWKARSDEQGTDFHQWVTEEAPKRFGYSKRGLFYRRIKKFSDLLTEDEMKRI